jgi:hypothetical protein
MSLIFAFSMELLPSLSPKQSFIRGINSMFNNQFCSPINLHQVTIEESHHSTLSLHEIQQSTNLVPTLNSLCRLPIKNLTDQQKYQWVHLSMLHLSPTAIKNMYRHPHILDLPVIKDMSHSTTCSCDLCNRYKVKRRSRGHHITSSSLQPFIRLHMDFNIYNITSIRGFVATFDAVCCSTSYNFSFPTRSKAPPLEIVRWLISTIRNMGFQVVFIRVDEDRALARSAEFCSLIVDLNCVLETTGGYNSENNGKVESQNYASAQSIRPALATSAIMIGHLLPNDMTIDQFWCFAHQYWSSLRRRTVNTSIGMTPYEAVHGSKPSFSHCFILGSLMTIVNASRSKPKISDTRSTVAYFLGYGNNYRFSLYWDPNDPHNYKRSYHSYIREIPTLERLNVVFSNPHSTAIDKTFPDPIYIKHLPQLENMETPFPPSVIKTYKLKLPPSNKSHGFMIKNDLLNNLPYLDKYVPGSIPYIRIPGREKTNKYIISINGVNPITAKFALQCLSSVQTTTTRILEIDLAPRGNADTNSTLEMHRAMFDQVPNLIQLNPAINELSSHIYDKGEQALNQFIVSPTKPSSPKDWQEAMKSKYKKNL